MIRRGKSDGKWWGWWLLIDLRFSPAGRTNLTMTFLKVATCKLPLRRDPAEFWPALAEFGSSSRSLGRATFHTLLTLLLLFFFSFIYWAVGVVLGYFIYFRSIVGSSILPQFLALFSPIDMCVLVNIPSQTTYVTNTPVLVCSLFRLPTLSAHGLF